MRFREKNLAVLFNCLIRSCWTVQTLLLLADRSRWSDGAKEFVVWTILKFVHLTWNNFFLDFFVMRC
jgi:hypothetical protein